MPIDIENFTMIQGHKKTGIKPNVVANTVILTPFSKHDHKGCTKFIEIVLSPNLVFKIVVKFGRLLEGKRYTISPSVIFSQT